MREDFVKSKGHVGFTDDGHEVIVCNDQIYIANQDDVLYSAGEYEGYRMGRWECSVDQYKHFYEIVFKPRGFPELS